jgi:hypothetical protein
LDAPPELKFQKVRKRVGLALHDLLSQFSSI